MPAPRSAIAFAALLALGASRADAGCGCDKPPPPRAPIRPFVGYFNQTVTLFNAALNGGGKYDVLFENRIDGTSGHSRGKAVMKRDLADRTMRPHLRVHVPDVGLGPCQITVSSNGKTVFVLSDDNFTVTSPPVQLHDFRENGGRTAYRAGVDRAGNVYIAVDVAEVTGATKFYGTAIGLPVAYQPQDVVIYNEQGFLMQLLDPSIPGLFEIYPGDWIVSSTLGYWRHEFRTYKAAHREQDAYQVSDDPDWHDNGTYHVDHDRLVIAVHGTLPDGRQPAPGATAPFRLFVSSVPQEVAAATR